MFGWFNRFRRKFAEKHSVGYWYHNERAKYPIRIAYDFSLLISKDRQLTKHEWHKLHSDIKGIWKSYKYLSKRSTYNRLEDISGPDYTTKQHTRKLSSFHKHVCADKKYPVRLSVFKRFDPVYTKIIILYKKYSDQTWMSESEQRIKVDRMYKQIHEGILDTVAYYTNKTVAMAEVIELPRVEQPKKRAA